MELHRHFRHDGNKISRVIRWSDLFFSITAQCFQFLRSIRSTRPEFSQVSTGLADRYKLLNKQVTSASNHRTTIDWGRFREDYAALSYIVKKVDNNVAPIILLSFANNLYFICLQLLNGLSWVSRSTARKNAEFRFTLSVHSQPDSTLVSKIYFFGSFAFLIGRTVIVTLLTARISDQSKVILPILYTCSTSAYNVEVNNYRACAVEGKNDFILI